MSEQPPPRAESRAPAAGAGTEALPRATDITAHHIVCPHCRTANRLDVATCVHCSRDLSMLRVIANKARHHFNLALEHAERGRWEVAVTELHNCLELDGSNVGAMVVLGTCLAKMERFDEARQAWTRALEVDPRFAKAHDYLGKVEHVAVAQRYHRRLRRVTALLLIVLGAVAVQVALRVRPDPLLSELRAANLAYRQGELGEALGHLDTVFQGAGHPEVQQAAVALSSAIGATIDAIRREIDEAQDERDWPRGIAAASRLRALNPSPADVLLAARIEAEMAGRLVEEARAELTQAAAGEAPATALARRLAAAADLMPTAGLRGDLQAVLASAEAVHRAQRADAFAAVAAGLPEDDPQARLATLVAAAPAWTDQASLETLVGDAARAVVTGASAEWDRLQADGDAEALDSFVAALQSRLSSPEFHGEAADRLHQAYPALVDAQGHLTAWEPLGALLVSAEALRARRAVEGALARAESLAEAGDWIAVRQALAAVDLEGAPPGVRTRAVALTSRAATEEARQRRREAIALFEQWLARDGAYETLRISEDEARETVENWERVVADVPGSLYGEVFRTVHCLLYAGRSWERLGDPGRAGALYERALATYPSSERAAQIEGYAARLRGNNPR